MTFLWAIRDTFDITESSYYTSSDRSRNTPSTSGRENVHFCVSHVTLEVPGNQKRSRLKCSAVRGIALPPLACLSICRTGPKENAGAAVRVAATKARRNCKEALKLNRIDEEKGRWLVMWEDMVDYAKHLAAGGLSSVVGRTVLAPLERLKLDMVIHEKTGMRQTAAEIFRTEGTRGFWKGNVINCLRTSPHKAINFFTFDAYRKALLHLTGNTEFGGAERFLAGAMAAVTATSICFPLDVLRTQMAVDRTKGLNVVKVMRTIVAKQGWGALYVGLWPALISMAPSGAVFYGVYDLLKEAYIRNHKVENAMGRSGLDATHTMLFGAIAGAASEAVVYPMEVIRRRMQVDSALRAGAGGSDAVTKRLADLARFGAKDSGVKGFQRAVAKIIKDKGIRGLYAGVGPSVLQVLPNAALSYYAYEWFKALLDVKS
eukprot:jgi/Botrbrau1/22030/Bobra.0024s0044.2